MVGPRGIPIGRYILGPVLRFLISLMLKIEMTGLEHLPKTGAGIIYYNHIHWLDPVLIAAKLPRYMRAVGEDRDQPLADRRRTDALVSRHLHHAWGRRSGGAESHLGRPGQGAHQRTFRPRARAAPICASSAPKKAWRLSPNRRRAPG